MPFPDGWPPRVSSGHKTFRFYLEATATANFSDRGYLFKDGTSANVITPLPDVFPGDDVSNPVYDGPHTVPATPAGTGQREGDPHPMIWSKQILLMNKGATEIEFSFDGTNVHGIVPPAAGGAYGKVLMDRHEAGIAIRGSGNDFVIMAW